jgi:hypothetical protein
MHLPLPEENAAPPHPAVSAWACYRSRGRLANLLRAFEGAEIVYLTEDDLLHSSPPWREIMKLDE